MGVLTAAAAGTKADAYARLAALRDDFARYAAAPDPRRKRDREAQATRLRQMIAEVETLDALMAWHDIVEQNRLHIQNLERSARQRQKGPECRWCHHSTTRDANGTCHNCGGPA